MGYSIKSRKINILLNEQQQKDIFNIWMNPSDDIRNSYWSLNVLAPIFKEENCTNIQEMLNMLGFEFEENKRRLKLKSHEAKSRHQKNLFSAIAHIITPGSFMTFRGEDGAFIGWFFTGKEILDYSSYGELKDLLTPFELKDNLEKKLLNENINNTIKPKI